MQKVLATAAVMIIIMATTGWTTEISSAQIISEPSKVKGKTVTVKGDFLYCESMRSSFMINQNGDMIEVFYRDLAKSDRDALLSLNKYSMVPVTVTGVVQFYTNSKNGFFVTATSVLIAGSTASAAAMSIPEVSLASLEEPAKYAGKTVTVKGEFLYSEPMRESFTIDEHGMVIEVFFKDIPKKVRDAMLSQKNYSKVPVTVTGVVQLYTNSTSGCFMIASNASLN